VSERQCVGAGKRVLNWVSLPQYDSLCEITWRLSIHGSVDASGSVIACCVISYAQRSLGDRSKFFVTLLDHVPTGLVARCYPEHELSSGLDPRGLLVSSNNTGTGGLGDIGVLCDDARHVVSTRHDAPVRLVVSRPMSCVPIAALEVWFE
jgi:hypothetical protein